MKRDEFLRIQERYRDALLKDCIPFWLKNGMDAEYGGMCTYLDREGKRYVSSPATRGRLPRRCAKNLEKFREYERIKAREYRAKKKLQATI